MVWIRFFHRCVWLRKFEEQSQIRNGSKTETLQYYKYAGSLRKSKWVRGNLKCIIMHKNGKKNPNIDEGPGNGLVDVYAPLLIQLSCVPLCGKFRSIRDANGNFHSLHNVHPQQENLVKEMFYQRILKHVWFRLRIRMNHNTFCS